MIFLAVIPHTSTIITFLHHFHHLFTTTITIPFKFHRKLPKKIIMTDGFLTNFGEKGMISVKNEYFWNIDLI